ncbi:hypothetical protein GCM10009715_26360 [Paeniglutamicibacter psychrophenolicus]|uniref:LPXTG-motif cell wall-anchored protein n=1 Tax=Paeniglutamicibacter psychrophenolicus TaxID=257454 RepID=A0ABS4WEJ8_9MICC|nr:S1 family peptidase [Paeniglutamicibacter psychrophenolicus]MBP2374590.1 LPXTG-motif cell wall-anchored protein [Paeniglutamicibacter psychrophenolicus]
MHDSSRALLKRGSIAAATTALVIGSSFAAPAIATTTASPEPVSTEMSAAPTVEKPENEPKAELPGGLKEALKRDLGISPEEFEERGDIAALADELQVQLKQAGLEATFELAEKTINVSVEASTFEAVTKKLNELTKDITVDLNVVAVKPLEISEADGKSSNDSDSKDDKTVEHKLDHDEAPKATLPAPTKGAEPKAEAPKTELKAPRSAEALLDAFVESVDADSVAQLQAVMETRDGFVIRSGGPATVESPTPTPSNARLLRVPQPEKLSPAEFADQFVNVTFEASKGPAKAADASDVLGGMGYGAPFGAPGSYALCSIGFNGFNGAGEAAAISAGHCTHDGAIKDVQIIEHDAPNDPSGIGSDLGTFGFSQFGGPGNSGIPGWTNTTPPKDYTNVGTDIAVIDKINPELTQPALVTKWGKGVDERESSTKVTGVASAIIGTDICKSGRTTGWQCGTVDEVGVFVVGGYKPGTDVRGVSGFGMMNPGFTKANEGDSGGAAIAGGNAVGVTSAIGQSEDPETHVVYDRAYFTDIKDGLKHTAGYSIALFLNAPAVATPASGSNVSAGETLNGTVAGAPTGSTVRIKSAGQKDISAKVANGKFSFKAPAKFGKFDFTLQTINGHNESTITAGSFNVVIGAPAITTPKNDATLNAPVSTISGTGVVGATVTLTGDATGTAKVAADGTWSVKLALALSYGEHSISATQARDGQTSKAVTSAFKIQLVAPAITTPANGKTYTEAQKVIAGTGVAGAEVKLTLPDAEQASAAATQLVTVGNDGKWSFTLEDDAALSYGSHSVTAVQSVGETTSAAAKSSFKVVPVAPSIDSPTDGQKFAFDEAPKTISGFGINGATIKVTIGDTELTATVADGAWTVLVPADLKSGDHKVTAVQVIDEVASASTSISFALAAEPKPEPTEEPTASPEPSEEPTASPKPSQEPEPSKAPVVPQGNTNDDDSDSDPLANTGPNAALPFIATGGVLLVAGGAFLLFRRKNTNGHHGA